MENSLYVGLSRQLVLERAMDMISNNVANVNTVGYRAQNPIFAEYISKEQNDKNDLSMVLDRGQYSTTSPGLVQFTGNPYDIALQGPGFIKVNTNDGGIQYTRAGNLTVNQKNELISSSGFKLSTTGGEPIVIPPNIKEVVITQNGTVTADGSTIGKIGIVEFENVQELQPEGNGLYSSKSDGTPAVNTIVKQGALEGSNVNAIQETTRMIDILRTYQSTMRMIQNEHERQVSAIQKLAQTNK